jgi:hypothetical protein
MKLNIYSFGLISITWVLLGAIIYHFAHGVQLDMVWLYNFTVVVLWWGLGVLFSLLAMRSGIRANVICGRISISVIVAYIIYFTFFAARIN